MPSDLGNGVDFFLVSGATASNHPQVPDSKLTLVITRGEQEFRMSVPTHHIDVAVMGFKCHLTLHLCSSQIPQLYSLVRWASCQHMLLRWTPLNVLNTTLVALQADLGLFHERRAVLVGSGIEPELGITRSWSQPTKWMRTPFQCIAFIFMPKLSNLGAAKLLFGYCFLLLLLILGAGFGLHLRLCWFIKGIYSSLNVIYANFSFIIPSGHNRRSIHWPQPINGASMRYAFKPDLRLRWPLIVPFNNVFFIIFRANVRLLVIMQCLRHLIPFQHIYLVFAFGETLTSSTEIHLHRVFIIYMFMQIQALIVNRLCRI